MKETQVYFARAATGQIKIGVSTDPEARIRTLNTGSPIRISLLKLIPGGYALERQLHQRFGTHRTVGEWFDPDPDMLRYIATLPGPTHFDYLCTLEPRLADLLVEAQSIRDRKKSAYFCANQMFFGQMKFKTRLYALVGWGAAHPDLRSSKAYESAYQALYNALPDCRNCRCPVG